MLHYVQSLAHVVAKGMPYGAISKSRKQNKNTNVNLLAKVSTFQSQRFNPYIQCIQSINLKVNKVSFSCSNQFLSEHSTFCLTSR